jgi:hypothetical protein
VPPVADAVEARPAVIVTAHRFSVMLSLGGPREPRPPQRAINASGRNVLT